MSILAVCYEPVILVVNSSQWFSASILERVYVCMYVIPRKYVYTKVSPVHRYRT